MLVQELYRRLSLGHLSNVAIGLDGSGDLSDLGKQQAVLHLNDALRSLSGRFNLLEETVLLLMKAGRSKYVLSPEFSFSRQQFKDEEDWDYHLIDTVTQPFAGRVVKVLKVYWDGHGELVLNETDNPASLHSAGETLIIPYPVADRVIGVNYQAYLPEVPEDAPEYNIPIPLVLETAVLLYTAARIYQNMQSPENMARGRTLMLEFENECALVKNEDLLGSSEIASLPKFNYRGFV